MCIFKIRKIYYDNIRLKSELKHLKEECQMLGNTIKQKEEVIKKYKSKIEEAEAYRIKIEEFKNALKMFAEGEADEEAFLYYANNDYSLDALIEFNKIKCAQEKVEELENLRMEPISFGDENR